MKFDPFHLRKVAGAFATGITLVTTKNGDGGVQAMTANSFLSVSLDPALVLFSVGKSAQMIQYLSIGQRIGISVLNHSQKEISSLYGGLPSTNPDVEFEDHMDCPIIKQNLAWYVTSVKNIIEVGDHYLVICAVEACNRNEGIPLIYYNGYKKLGGENE